MAILGVFWVLLCCGSVAWAGPGDRNADSLYLVGEFVDPVCIFQHGMQGVLQRKCAVVPGRIDQGVYFLDIRERRLYSVIGQTHWENPRQAFLDALGDTFAVTGRVWRRAGSAAIAIGAVHPYRQQPEPGYRWWPWDWEWTVLLGCGVLAALYVLALTCLRRRLTIPGGVEPWRVAAFFSGLLIVVVALMGPLHDLSDLYLFSTHMVQHLLLAQAFPLLFVLGIPPWLWRWLLAPPAISAAWRVLAGVPIGFILYTVVFSIWHVPLFYNSMMRDHEVHVVMHIMVMATAVLMWWPLLKGSVGEASLAPPAKMLYLFVLGTPMMAVAALITFADRPLYEWYALAPRFMGISALDDQRLGGLLMWIPGALFYWAAMSVVYFRWAAQERARDDEWVAGAART